jgi:hypothetical protein
MVSQGACSMVAGAEPSGLIMLLPLISLVAISIRRLS